MRPPVTYPCHLHDLELFADAASELDACKNNLPEPERARVLAMVCRLHETVERIAGHDADMIYAPVEA